MRCTPRSSCGSPPKGARGPLHLEGVVGRLAPGAEADLVVLDLASTPAIAQRANRAEDLWEAVFPTLMMGDDRAVRATWVGGREGTRPALDQHWSANISTQ
jgi:guanine deaminase